MEKLARHLKSFYGGSTFSRIVKDLSDNTPIKDIAEYANVSRQTIYQWRQKLGKEQVFWVPHKQVLDLTTVENSNSS